MKELFNRELSWLSFNERVLQESLDKQIPLVERMRFLGIYSNNMDEFFRVRVANVNRMISFKGQKMDGFDGNAGALLTAIQHQVSKQRKVYELAYKRILTELEKHQIFHVNEQTVPEKFIPELSGYYHGELKQDIVPIMLDKKHKFPRLMDKEIYLAVRMSGGPKDKVRYALIQVPGSHSRFRVLRDGDTNYIILLDDIVRLFLQQIFSIFEVDEISAFTFKFTRDAELNLDDDITISMFDKMEESIKQRKKGEPVRFIYDGQMPKDLIKYLKESIGTAPTDHIVPGGRYHNFKDLMSFPDFGKSELVFQKRKPAAHPDFEKSNSILKMILTKDVLLHYPYQKFDHLVDFLREAAIDPKVRDIKINIYRVARRSQIINALINAIKNGKEVTVVVELQARFDEENNMYWSTVLREHGARIIYGVPGLKVHSKLIQVTRFSGKKEQTIVHVGTGNFHGGNAKIYTDFGLLTAKPEITREVKKVFALFENNIERGTFRYILVSPFNTRRKFLQLIEDEIKNAKKGLPAAIDIKINNLVDSKMIKKLYDASNAGVKVRAIVRGICCLVPGVKKQSENIEVRSVVGRYLEHSRTITFHNNGDPIYYITSADWMQRNLDKRIEVSTVVLDDDIKRELREVFEIQWLDNVKARIVDQHQRNLRKRRGTDEALYNSQEILFERYAEIEKVD
jgi:polyphosphate kinase